MDKKKEPISLYIHIPFCIRKCQYCDFLSAPATVPEQKSYMEALCREILQEAPNYTEYEVVSVFVGGGTPSVLAPEEIRNLFRVLYDSYSFRKECEITIEVNPGTISAEKLSCYLACGINRLSIGLQSAQNNELRALGRIHGYEDFQKTYEMAVKSGFSNINVDLMAAIPEQSLSSYRDTLQRVLELSPPPSHISAYSLMIEEGTPFYEKTPELPDEDTEREMYKITGEILERAGYYRYEISNYAKEGRECFHNKVYWSRGNYIGFGIGSASLFQEHRWKNQTDINSYVNYFETKNSAEPDRQGKQENEGMRCEMQELSVEEQMEEFMFLGLRMMKGVSEQEFYQHFHRTFAQTFPGIVEKYEKLGLLTREKIGNTDFSVVKLTSHGIDVSNVVMADFLLT